MAANPGTSLGGQIEKLAPTLRADFRFAPFDALLLVAIFVAGLVFIFALFLQCDCGAPLCGLCARPRSDPASGSGVGVGCDLGNGRLLLAYWSSGRTARFCWLRKRCTPYRAIGSECLPVGTRRSPSLREVRRAGSPGFRRLLVIEKAARFVDQRIRVTDFSAETTLIRIRFPSTSMPLPSGWSWIRKKAVLEVEKV